MAEGSALPLHDVAFLDVTFQTDPHQDIIAIVIGRVYQAKEYGKKKRLHGHWTAEELRSVKMDDLLLLIDHKQPPVGKIDRSWFDEKSGWLYIEGSIRRSFFGPHNPHTIEDVIAAIWNGKLNQMSLSFRGWIDDNEEEDDETKPLVFDMYYKEMRECSLVENGWVKGTYCDLAKVHPIYIEISASGAERSIVQETYADLRINKESVPDSLKSAPSSAANEEGLVKSDANLIPVPSPIACSTITIPLPESSVVESPIRSQDSADSVLGKNCTASSSGANRALLSFQSMSEMPAQCEIMKEKGFDQNPLENSSEIKTALTNSLLCPASYGLNDLTRSPPEKIEMSMSLKVPVGCEDEKNTLLETKPSPMTSDNKAVETGLPLPPNKQETNEKIKTVAVADTIAKMPPENGGDSNESEARSSKENASSLVNAKIESTPSTHIAESTFSPLSVSKTHVDAEENKTMAHPAPSPLHLNGEKGANNPSILDQCNDKTFSRPSPFPLNGTIRSKKMTLRQFPILDPLLGMSLRATKSSENTVLLSSDPHSKDIRDSVSARRTEAGTLSTQKKTIVPEESSPLPPENAGNKAIPNPTTDVSFETTHDVENKEINLDQKRQDAVKKSICDSPPPPPSPLPSCETHSKIMEENKSCLIEKNAQAELDPPTSSTTVMLPQEGEGNKMESSLDARNANEALHSNDDKIAEEKTQALSESKCEVPPNNTIRNTESIPIPSIIFKKSEKEDSIGKELCDKIGERVEKEEAIGSPVTETSPPSNILPSISLPEHNSPKESFQKSTPCLNLETSSIGDEVESTSKMGSSIACVEIKQADGDIKSANSASLSSPLHSQQAIDSSSGKPNPLVLPSPENKNANRVETTLSVNSTSPPSVSIKSAVDAQKDGSVVSRDTKSKSTNAVLPASQTIKKRVKNAGRSKSLATPSKIDRVQPSGKTKKRARENASSLLALEAFRKAKIRKTASTAPLSTANHCAKAKKTVCTEPCSRVVGARTEHGVARRAAAMKERTNRKSATERAAPKSSDSSSSLIMNAEGEGTVRTNKSSDPARESESNTSQAKAQENRAAEDTHANSEHAEDGEDAHSDLAAEAESGLTVEHDPGQDGTENDGAEEEEEEVSEDGEHAESETDQTNSVRDDNDEMQDINAADETAGEEENADEEDAMPMDPESYGQEEFGNPNDAMAQDAAEEHAAEEGGEEYDEEGYAHAEDTRREREEEDENERVLTNDKMRLIEQYQELIPVEVNIDGFGSLDAQLAHLRGLYDTYNALQEAAKKNFAAAISTKSESAKKAKTAPSARSRPLAKTLSKGKFPVPKKPATAASNRSALSKSAPVGANRKRPPPVDTPVPAAKRRIIAPPSSALSSAPRAKAAAKVRPVTPLVTLPPRNSLALRDHEFPPPGVHNRQNFGNNGKKKNVSFSSNPSQRTSRGESTIAPPPRSVNVNVKTKSVKKPAPAPRARPGPAHLPSNFTEILVENSAPEDKLLKRLPPSKVSQNNAQSNRSSASNGAAEHSVDLLRPIESMAKKKGWSPDLIEFSRRRDATMLQSLEVQGFHAEKFVSAPIWSDTFRKCSSLNPEIVRTQLAAETKQIAEEVDQRVRFQSQYGRFG